MTKEILLARSIRMICAGGRALGASTATAQESSEPLQKVLITGSRIASPVAESPPPLQILSSADIAGVTTVNPRNLGDS